MKNKNPLVSIQILNWNRGDETVRAIQSALNQTYKNIEIVIVDNGSTDDSIQKIENSFPEIKLIKLNKNYGCPGGRNRGISYCKGEYIFFCDNDGVLHKDAVKNAMKCMMKNGQIAIVTGTVRNFVFEDEIDTNYELPEPTFTQTNLFEGGICLHKKIIYKNIDKYPDDYMYGGEETYLAMRVLDAGYSIIKSSEVVLWHKKSLLARDEKKEILLSWRNKLATAYQLYPLEYFIAFFIYYCSRYPLYAMKKGFLKDFLKSSIDNIKRLKEYERKPIKRITYKTFVQKNSK